MLTLEQSERIFTDFGIGVTFYTSHPITGLQESAVVVGFRQEPRRGHLDGVRVEFPDGTRAIIEPGELLKIEIK